MTRPVICSQCNRTGENVERLRRSGQRPDLCEHGVPLSYHCDRCGDCPTQCGKCGQHGHERPLDDLRSTIVRYAYCWAGFMCELAADEGDEAVAASLWEHCEELREVINARLVAIEGRDALTGESGETEG